MAMKETHQLDSTSNEDCIRIPESRKYDCMQMELKQAKSQKTKSMNTETLHNSEILSKMIMGKDRKMDPKKPLFTIVIATFNSMSSHRNLDLTLRSIVKQSYKNWEILLIDNFSTDDTLKTVSTYPVKLYQINSNISKANNLGIEKARGDYILFLDSDQVLTSGFLEECAKLIKDFGVDCIGYINVFVDPNSHYRSSKCNLLRNIESFLGAEPSDGIYCYSRRIINDKAFDERLKALVDYYFRREILENNPSVNVGYVKSLVLHFHPPSVSWHIKRWLRYGRVFRKALRSRTRLSSGKPTKAIKDYFFLTKRNKQNGVPTKFVSSFTALLFPLFLTAKYFALVTGFLLESVNSVD